MLRHEGTWDERLSGFILHTAHGGTDWVFLQAKPRLLAETLRRTMVWIGGITAWAYSLQMTTLGYFKDRLFTFIAVCSSVRFVLIVLVLKEPLFCTEGFEGPLKCLKGVRTITGCSTVSHAATAVGRILSIADLCVHSIWARKSVCFSVRIRSTGIPSTAVSYDCI